MNGKKIIAFVLGAVVLLSACQKPTGSIRLAFTFTVDGTAMQQDTLLYENEAGNRYEVTEAQYFISNVVLTAADGSQYAVKSDKSAHYVDADLQNTLTWTPDEEFPTGSYKAITFVFGLAPELNVSHSYTDAPENNMSWPASLGGGYHNMKINGRWVGEDGARYPFNLHSGRVLTAAGDTIENSFAVTLPLNHAVVVKNEAMDIVLNMDVNRWFSSPYVFDLNYFGGSIMQNAEAQETLKANGWDVFSINSQL